VKEGELKKQQFKQTELVLLPATLELDSGRTYFYFWNPCVKPSLGLPILQSHGYYELFTAWVT